MKLSELSALVVKKIQGKSEKKKVKNKTLSYTNCKNKLTANSYILTANNLFLRSSTFSVLLVFYLITLVVKKNNEKQNIK